MQFVYECYRAENEEIFCILSVLLLRLTICASFLQLFQVFSVPTVPNLVLISLNLNEYQIHTGTIPYERYIEDDKMGVYVISSL